MPQLYPEMNTTNQSRAEYFKSIEDLPPESLFNLLKFVPTVELFLEVSKFSSTLGDFIYSRMEFRREIEIKPNTELSKLTWLLALLGPELKRLTIENRSEDFNEILNHAAVVNPNISFIRMHNIVTLYDCEEVFKEICLSKWSNLQYVVISNVATFWRPAEGADEN